MTEYLRIAFFIVILGGLGKTVFAQDGPVIPCTDCPEFTSNPLPQTGIWFNPGQSGTGFMLEVQANLVAGYYYLYDNEGRPMWLLLVGELIRSDESGITWVLEADLEQLEGGSCLSCPYQPPEAVEPAGKIRIEFLQRNFARFQIDDSPFQNIWTMTYGVAGAAEFAPTTDYLVPDLSGRWVFSSVSASMQSQAAYLTGFTRLPEGGFSYQVARDAPDIVGPPIPIIGELRCGALNDIEGPICEVTFETFGDSMNLKFITPLGNLGPSRISAESEVGHSMLHGYRIDFN